MHSIRQNYETRTLNQLKIDSDKEQADVYGSTYINLEPDFQRKTDCWNTRQKSQWIESLILGRFSNPIWAIPGADLQSYEILDGLHRIKTGILFMNGSFQLQGKYLMDLSKEKYNGKKFAELSYEDQEHIKKYPFQVNYLGASYRNPAKLQEMYALLNASSSTLNKHELNKPILRALYDIISEFLESCAGNLGNGLSFLLSKTDKRGSHISQVIEILALTYDIPHTWTNRGDIVEKWQDKYLNKQCISAEELLTEENRVSLMNRLSYLKEVVSILTDHRYFSYEVRKGDDTIHRMVIGRVVFFVNERVRLEKVVEKLVGKVKSEILEKNLLYEWGLCSKDGRYQKKMLSKVDKIIEDVLGIGKSVM